MKKQKELLGSKDVAWILDCSPDEVIVLARRNALRAKKEGRFWRYRYKDVVDYRDRQPKRE